MKGKFRIVIFLLIINIIMILYLVYPELSVSFAQSSTSSILGDLDGDGQVSVNDLAILKLHYIEKQTLEGEKLKLADLDNDGEITANDIAKMKLILIGLADLEYDTIKTITFTDSCMYNKVREELGDKVIQSNDNEKSMSISLRNIETVTKLKLNNSNISDIRGIENFTALTELDISNNSIVDINDLSSLTKLRSLSAYGNAIADVSSISNLTSLKYLNISKNRLTDSKTHSENTVTNSISTLTNLKELDISHNYLRYTNGLKPLTNLTYLNLYDNAIHNLTGLETLTNLTYLNLGENNENGPDKITGLESLEKLTKLKEFDFSENRTPEIVDYVKNLTDLEILSLQRNEIRYDIAKLGNLTNLKVLNLYYNSLETIPQELSNLANLEELILGNNWLYDIKGLYTDDTINFKNLKKIDLSKNTNIENLFESEKPSGHSTRVDNNLKIMKLLQNDVDELNDENITDTSNLPHYDANNIAYVTYEDFGARCDGKYDDFIAIRNAHIFANENGCEVRATEGKNYHIFKYYEEAVTVKTNVDWQNANFIIHDEKIEKVSGRYQGLFKFTNIKDETIIDNPTWTIRTSTKQIIGINDKLKELNAKGYQKYFCAAVNSDKKQYIRYGFNGNAGADQQDYFIVDNQGNVLNDIQWDFEKITKFTIYPIPETSLSIKNGNFITNAIESKSETPYTRAGSGKGIYFTRNIYIYKAANVNISGINHKLSYELDKDEMSGSYTGFINTNTVANIEISDSSLFTRKNSIEGRSMYGLNLSANVNVKCKNITSNNITDLDRYGIVGTFFSKDVLFEDCKLNRIDAHEGIYNLTVKNCHIGSKGLTMTGQGTLNVIGTTIESDTFITLRPDYGSTWNGNVNIIDCTYKYNGIWMPKLFNVFLSYDNNKLHDFGYDCRMPNINVHNFTIDMRQNPKSTFYIMSINGMKFDKPYLENTKKYLQKYLPDNINLNQYKFVNTAGDIKLKVANTNGNGELETYLKDYSYVISNAVLKEKDSQNNLLQQIDFTDNFIFNKPLDFEISRNDLTQNKVSIYKDGQILVENQIVEDKYTYEFKQEGTYKIEISSLDEKNQYKGMKTYEFTIQEECPYDKYNVTGISYWTPLPMVSEELLEKEEVTTGGEGCQWPIGMDISKDGKLFLYGTDVGGVYRSEDGGRNFEQSNAGLGSRGVGAFSIDPTNSNFVIAQGINSGPCDTNGLYISEDSGKTWKMTKSMLIKGHRDIRDSIQYDESSYSKEKNRCMIAYWSTAYDTEENKLKEDEKGLYKTTDGGYTWELINSDLCDGTIKINPYTGEVYISKADGIYYSSDKGLVFRKIVDNEITGFDMVATETKNVYLYYCNHNEVYRSENGQSFEKIDSKSYPTKSAEETGTMHIKVSPVDPNKMVVVHQEARYVICPYYSEDGGKTWQKSTLDNELSFMPINKRVSIPMWSKTQDKVWLFVQGDFVSSSTDGGKTFNWDSNGIAGILCGGHIHHNVYNPDLIYFGSQDYNGCVTTDGGKTWKYINMSGAKWGGFCYGGYAVDENTYFVGVAEGDKNSNPRKLKITFDGGKTVVDTGMYFTQENLRASIESSYQSPNNPKVLFACDLRSDDGGHTWKKMDGCINVYTHNPKGEKELYGMDETAQYVVVSYDDGVTWKKVNNEAFTPNPKFPSLKIDDIAYDWKNESVYVAAGWGYLYRVSVKTGDAEFVLNKYLDKYKNAPLNSKGAYVITRVAVDPNDPNIVYCGGAGNTYLNDCSLYRSVDGGKTFQVMTSNTSSSIIRSGKQGGFETNSIEVNPKTGELLFSGGCFGISKLTPPYNK